MQEVSILDNNPGPGSYLTDTMNSSFSTLKGISMAQRYPERKTESPGPSTYK